MTTGDGSTDPNPYVTEILETPLGGDTLDIEIKVAITTVKIGIGPDVRAETYNGTIPGPTLVLNKGDTVIVRLVNDLPYPTGIHWHGIELHNPSDGTPVTQEPAASGPFSQPVAASPSGGTYLYKFTADREGIFWYHPHHFHSTNRVFRGLYGMIIVRDPNEAVLTGEGAIPPPGGPVLPPAAQTLRAVLSDITVCGAPTTNPSETYPDAEYPGAERLGGAGAQAGPSPQALCELPDAIQEDGSTASASYVEGQVPNIQRAMPGTTVEGRTVLTNGVNVGSRLGTPLEPGGVTPSMMLHPVQAGQGLRLQLANCAHARYFRLILTRDDMVSPVPPADHTDPLPNQIDLVRVGGEGGLLDRAILEGGTIDGFATGYAPGEILLPAASRADVVVAIPPDLPVGSVLTLWTRDFQRIGPGVGTARWSRLPTVPVMHFEVTGVAPGTFTITGTPQGGGLATNVRAATGDLVAPLTGPTTDFLDPGSFVPSPTPKLGIGPGVDITLDATGGAAMINDVSSATALHGVTPYPTTPHIGSTRYVETGDTVLIRVRNTTQAHHPFHLHGFSFQPVALYALPPPPGDPDVDPLGAPVFTWQWTEFVDVMNIPNGHALEFKVRIADRKLADGLTDGGALGRWLFHCHIFFHAHSGMLSELVVVAANGRERPYIDVGGSWTYAGPTGPAQRSGPFYHPEGQLMTLSASKGTVSPPGPSPGGMWSWTYTAGAAEPESVEYVYITATDEDGRQSQTVFRLQINGVDQGSDSGDPHIRTVDGRRYDFQAVGEFVLLRDREGMEVQTRQTPVPTQHPITDAYSGLQACVSVNTAVAVRVGRHRIAYQPGREQGQLEFFVDGRLSRLSDAGLELDGHRVSRFDAGGSPGLRIDYAHHAVVQVTPKFWTGHDVWYMNVEISHTLGNEGLMGPIPKGSWLPKLGSGAVVGPMPKSLHERWVTLYRRFADSWRVTDATSLFVYAPGTSTATFTDRDWPAEEGPCQLKPGFAFSGPALTGMPVEEARRVCQAVTVDDLNQGCVFDVATTGDPNLVEGYLTAQDLRLSSTSIRVVVPPESARDGEPVSLLARVATLTAGRPAPTGGVQFFIDGISTGAPIPLDAQGRATWSAALTQGTHRVSAEYRPSGATGSYHRSRSPDVVFAVLRPGPKLPPPCPPAEHRPGRRCWAWVLLVVVAMLILGRCGCRHSVSTLDVEPSFRSILPSAPGGPPAFGWERRACGGSDGRAS